MVYLREGQNWFCFVRIFLKSKLYRLDGPNNRVSFISCHISKYEITIFVLFASIVTSDYPHLITKLLQFLIVSLIIQTEVKTVHYLIMCSLSQVIFVIFSRFLMKIQISVKEAQLKKKSKIILLTPFQISILPQKLRWTKTFLRRFKMGIMTSFNIRKSILQRYHPGTFMAFHVDFLLWDV